MSRSINFFIRGKDNFYPIGSYSGNTAIYQMFIESNVGSWEKVSPMTYLGIEQIRTSISENKRGFGEMIIAYEDKIELIKKMKNSVEEKMEYISSYTKTIEEYKETVDELDKCYYFISFIEGMMEECEWSWDVNPEEYVYVGFEISNPSKEDIIEC